ncbi:hypothetical protein H320_02365 [Vibrio parahaemolyticus 49]|nr:hypothetical protein H320_02365 [Vibrio parahaemolyticus 49]
MYAVARCDEAGALYDNMLVIMLCVGRVETPNVAI